MGDFEHATVHLLKIYYISEQYTFSSVEFI